jgi:hypothetical protein
LAKKVGNPEKIVKSVKELKTQILCHGIEPNPSKDRAVHEGDNPSFLDEFMKFTFFLTALLIFIFLINNYQQFLYNMANNYHLHPSSPLGSGLE